METRYQEIIGASLDQSSSMLNALHAMQDAEGYLSRDSIQALSEHFGVTATEVSETASFYSMLRFTAPAATRIEVCKGAPCHVAGAQAVVEALESTLGLRMGERSADGHYSLDYVECLGQCDTSPSILINGELHTGMSPAKVEQLFAQSGFVSENSGGEVLSGEEAEK